MAKAIQAIDPISPPVDQTSSSEAKLGIRMAIELDGGQHLADPIAYRRDRRKDQLLQENGYFVLRFLAEDLGKELDTVLDAILRTLARRRQSGTRADVSGSYGDAVNEA